MAVITLWLSVFEPESDADKDKLYFKILNTPYAPHTGDKVHILYDEDNDEWAIGVDVRKVYWNGDGTVHAELAAYQVDPIDRKRLNPGYDVAWNTQEDGDLKRLLLNSGWRPYTV